jgi:hypothetical protein
MVIGYAEVGLHVRLGLDVVITFDLPENELAQGSRHLTMEKILNLISSTFYLEPIIWECEFNNILRNEFKALMESNLIFRVNKIQLLMVVTTLI